MGETSTQLGGKSRIVLNVEFEAVSELSTSVPSD